jgi:GNAT superfamily N-acetyltransferase
MNSAVDVRPATSRQDIEDFIRFPFSLYRNDPNWVPPLLSERREFMTAGHNPFFAHADVALWLARRDGEVVGRISSHIDHLHNKTHDEKLGMYGFFESVNDFAVADALLSTAHDWVKSRGMEALRGPLSFSQNHEVGLFVDGDPGRAMVMMPYNPPYYDDFFRRFGLGKVMDVYAYVADLTQFHGDASGMPEKLARVTSLAKKRAGITTRTPNLKRFEHELRLAKAVYNQAWEKNWGFVPMTDDEVDKLAGDLKQVLDARLCVIVESGDRPVGISVAVPDVNQVFSHLNGRLFPLGWVKALWYARKVNGARLMIMGVVEDFRGRGIEAVLMYETVKAAIEAGYINIEFSWILETNEMMNRIIGHLGEPYGARRYRTYRIYQMAV